MVIIKIKTGNAAFADGMFYQEVANILNAVSSDIFAGRIPNKLFDSNGNSVGSLSITGKR